MLAINDNATPTRRMREPPLLAAFPRAAISKAPLAHSRRPLNRANALCPCIQSYLNREMTEKPGATLSVAPARPSSCADAAT
ncbi:hypothetical protein BRAS3843_20031 [Bradyrhizobium sp. STM 3843]|nr:hypothetical protein BRAS3843_20031 [Bradyrhizobium sp. STM 3843]